MKKFYSLLLLVCSIACVSHHAAHNCVGTASNLCAVTGMKGASAKCNTGFSNNIFDTYTNNKSGNYARVAPVSQLQLLINNVNACTANNPSGRVPGTGILNVFFDVDDFETVTA